MAVARCRAGRGSGLLSPTPVSRALLLTLLLGAAGCGAGPTAPSGAVRVEFDFARSTEGWVAGFSDYPFGWEEKMELVADHRPLPTPLDQRRGGLFIAGSNRSDDLFMFWKRRVDGLRADRAYAVAFVVEFATNVPKGVGGIGRPDGDVFVKAGASRLEPVAVPGPLAHCLTAYNYCLSTDKGNQAQEGKDAINIGTAGNLSGTTTWELKELKSDAARLVVTPAADGSVWLLVGTDSGFEGRTSLYYTRVVAQFTPVSPSS